MFSRIAIVNRGEAAMMRVINAVREQVAETATPIETVALHTDVDRTATFVAEADITYDLGPASARPYLDLKTLERALVETGPMPRGLAGFCRRRPGVRGAVQIRSRVTPASTSTATCRASTSSGPGCRKRSRSNSPRRSANTASLPWRSPELGAAVFRIFFAQQRMSADATAEAAAGVRRRDRPRDREFPRAQCAVEVGSVDAVIRAAELRLRIIEAIESHLR